MSEVLTAVKSTQTTTPLDTHVEVSHTLTDGILLYRPEDNAFIALYSDEWLVCRADAHENKTAIEELQEANRVVTEKALALQQLLQQPNASKAAIAQAKKDLDAALDAVSKKSDAAKKRIEAITDQKTDKDKLVELLPLTLKRMEGRTHTPIYVSAQKLQSALRDKRVYLVEGAAERTKRPTEKLFNGTTLNAQEARHRIANQVQDKAKFEKKWKLAPDDADQFSGILTDWAKVMGASATAFLDRGQKEILEGVLGKENTDPNNPHRIVDCKPEAQFMRWSGGASSEAVFMPFQGNFSDERDRTLAQKIKRAGKAAQFSVKANAEASFAIGEAKIPLSVYFPHAAGWHLCTAERDRALDFGYLRLRADVTLYALAGASVALEAGAALMVTGGKQGLRGTPAHQAGAKAKVGAKGEAKVFAGLKEGVSLKGALQWLNPEGYSDHKNPKKVELDKAIAEYTDLASITADVSLIQGLAATLGFECDYRDGSFVIAAKAGACLGLGGSGCVGAKVGEGQIAQFFMCIAHQLKQSDYKKIAALMNEGAFFVFNKILYLAVATNSSIEKFSGALSNTIDLKYHDVVESLSSSSEKLLKSLENQLKSGWGWYSYMPPEARGATIASIGISLQNSPVDSNLRHIAAFCINELFSTTQSIGHLNKTLDRITVEIGQVPGRNQGMRLVSSIISDTMFEGCVDRCEMQLANTSPLMGRPFMRNDEQEFIAAQFPLHHAAYLV